jgi:type IV pilus assembly protein PilB
MPTAMEKRLGEMLIKDQIISRQDFDGAAQKQTQTGVSLGRILIDMGKASEWEVAATLGKQLNVPFITLAHYDIDPDVLKSIPADLARKYKIVPVDRTGDSLTVALADPSNIYLLDELRLLTQCQIIPVISFESDIKEAIEKYYPAGQGENADEALKDIADVEIDAASTAVSEAAAQEEAVEEEDLSLNADDAPVVQLVNMIISEAIKMRASDIHVEPYEKTLRLRYRVDGVLQEMTPPPKKFQNAILSRIKILSDLDIAEKRLPQDGRFKVRIQNKSVDFRVSSCPIQYGEKIVIRILDQSNLQLRLTDLGFESGILKKVEAEIRKPWGMALVTGPTGSGKSTTLYSALSTINDPSKNICTIEDPVEYQIPGINQVHARADIGLTFAAGLRSFLRQDPDIIMIGEIRDQETGEIAVKAALTGHLVLSTLHTNDAPSTITRLTNMGIEAFLVTASLNLVVAQRLVRRICVDCKAPFVPLPELLESVGMRARPSQEFFQGKGCPSCNGTGFRGRVALYEVMVMTDAMRDAIIAGATTTELKRMAIHEGMETLRMAGINKVIEGRTTIEEVIGATMSDNLPESRVSIEPVSSDMAAQG